MEPQLTTLEVLEVLERLDKIKEESHDLAVYAAPSTLAQVAVKLTAAQKELLAALIARELEKSL
jgi:hypothetical protein